MCWYVTLFVPLLFLYLVIIPVIVADPHVVIVRSVDCTTLLLRLLFVATPALPSPAYILIPRSLPDRVDLFPFVDYRVRYPLLLIVGGYSVLRDCLFGLGWYTRSSVRCLFIVVLMDVSCSPRCCGPVTVLPVVTTLHTSAPIYRCVCCLARLTFLICCSFVTTLRLHVTDYITTPPLPLRC